MKLPAVPRVFGFPFFAALALLISGCVSQPSRPSAEQLNPALTNPQTNSAIRPEPRDPKWVQRHEGFVEEAKRGGIDVLFVGDSITDFWRSRDTKKGGRAVWDREFAPLHAANFGISGDRTQHVLWRLQHGEVDGINPKVVVLMIGTNNTGLENDQKRLRNTKEEAAAGVKAVIREIRTRLPHSRLLLLAVFPRGETAADPHRPEIDYINQQIAPLADGKNIRFLDLGPSFLAADGTLPKEIMPDSLHPSEKGYEIWAATMKPVLQEMLKGR